jgi:hypothetical protein
MLQVQKTHGQRNGKKMQFTVPFIETVTADAVLLCVAGVPASTCTATSLDATDPDLEDLAIDGSLVDCLLSTGSTATTAFPGAASRYL